MLSKTIIRKLSVWRRQRGFADLLDEAFGPKPVADQIRRRDDLQAVVLGEVDQIGDPRHRPVFLHDFANNARRNQACDARKIHRSLGLAGADQHAAIASAQRKNMAGPREIAGLRFGIDGREDGLRPIVGGDSGGNISPRFDRNAERRAVL